MDSIDDLKQKLYQEKLKTAQRRLLFRFIAAVIILFAIGCFGLSEGIDNMGAIARLISIIGIVAYIFIVGGLIFHYYSLEEEEAKKVIEPDWKEPKIGIQNNNSSLITKKDDEFKMAIAKMTEILKENPPSNDPRED